MKGRVSSSRICFGCKRCVEKRVLGGMYVCTYLHTYIRRRRARQWSCSTAGSAHRRTAVRSDSHPLQCQDNAVLCLPFTIRRSRSDICGVRCVCVVLDWTAFLTPFRCSKLLRCNKVFCHDRTVSGRISAVSRQPSPCVCQVCIAPLASAHKCVPCEESRKNAPAATATALHVVYLDLSDKRTWLACYRVPYSLCCISYRWPLVMVAYNPMCRFVLPIFVVATSFVMQGDRLQKRRLARDWNQLQLAS